MAEYDSAERKILLQTAKDSIVYGLTHDRPLPIELSNYTPHLQQPRACFVTLLIHKNLRGCIGSLIATAPLILDVARNAYNAAFEDPRFPRLNNSELANIEMDISVLSPPTRLKVSSEAELLSQLRPGVDGLIISDNGHKATFLPSVWEQLPNPKDFVIHLKNKAGLPSNYWSNTISIETYISELIS